MTGPNNNGVAKMMEELKAAEAAASQPPVIWARNNPEPENRPAAVQNAAQHETMSQEQVDRFNEIRRQAAARQEQQTEVVEPQRPTRQPVRAAEEAPRREENRGARNRETTQRVPNPGFFDRHYRFIVLAVFLLGVLYFLMRAYSYGG